MGAFGEHFFKDFIKLGIFTEFPVVLFILSRQSTKWLTLTVSSDLVLTRNPIFNSEHHHLSFCDFSITSSFTIWMMLGKDKYVLKFTVCKNVRVITGRTELKGRAPQPFSTQLERNCALWCERTCKLLGL